MSVRVYPNPTTGMINVQCLKINVQNIEIFDLMGRMVMPVETLRATSLQQHPTTINISHFPSGVYFLRITTESGVVVRKVVKQ
jgi:hypothetical protein